MKLSVIITNLNNAHELWFTIQSVLYELSDADYEYEVIVTDNGSDGSEAELVQNYVAAFAKYYPIRLVNYTRIKSCPGIRMAGIWEAKGDLICFMDGHVIPAKDYFKNTIPLFNDPDVYVVCAPERYYGELLYEYTMQNQLALEQSTTTWKPISSEPYPIASACYACTMIRRETKDFYFIDDELDYIPYSTDEPYVSLLPWMFGKKTLMNTKTSFAHRPWAYTLGGDAGYEAWRPLGAYALGGMDAYEKSFNFWKGVKRFELPEKHRKFIEENAKVKFADLGDYLTKQGVQR